MKRVNIFMVVLSLMTIQSSFCQVPNDDVRNKNYEAKRKALVDQLTATIDGTGDPFKISQLPDQVSRDEAKRFAVTVREYVTNNAPLTDAQNTVLKGSRRSGNKVIKDIAREVSWIKMTQSLP